MLGLHDSPHHADAVAWAARAPLVEDGGSGAAPGSTAPATRSRVHVHAQRLLEQLALGALPTPTRPARRALARHRTRGRRRRARARSPAAPARADELGLTAKLTRADAAVVRFAILRHSLHDHGAAELAAELAASEDEAQPSGAAGARAPRPLAAQGRRCPGPRPSRPRRVRRSAPASPPGDRPRSSRSRARCSPCSSEAAGPATSTLVTLVCDRGGLLASCAHEHYARHRATRSVAPAAAAPRLVFFGVASRKELARLATAAAPGVRFASRRVWTEDPGEPRRSLLRGEPATGLWWWKGTREEFEAQATEILLRLVHPLVARGLPFCLGFPFGAEVLEPRTLAVGESAGLDLEDIGRLLRTPAARGSSAPIRRASAPAAASRRGPASGPDAVRLDDAQRAAVEHACGPARVLAPAGSGKTKTLVSRVVELVDRGADPFGDPHARLQPQGGRAARGAAGGSGHRLHPSPRLPLDDAGPDRRAIRRGPPTGRRAAGRPRPDRPAGVHCATFNAFGYRYQREVLRARFSLDHDGRSLRALMARAMETAGVSLRDLKPRRGSDPVGAFMSGLTRVRAALEPPADGGGADRIRRRDPPARPAVRARPRAVHPRAGRDRPAVVRRPDLLRRRRHAGGPGTSGVHPVALRPRAGGRVPGPERRAARARGRAFAATSAAVRRRRRRPAHLRLAAGRPARHPGVPPADAAQAMVGHVHPVHQLPLLARRRGDRCAPRRQQRRARGQGHPAARGRAGRRRPVLRRAVLAGARRGRVRLPARREGAPRLRLARPGRALSLPLAAAAGRARRSTPATCRGRRRWAARSSRTRRRSCCARTWTWCARRTSCRGRRWPAC